MSERLSWKLGSVLAVAGAVIVVASSLVGSGFAPGALLLGLWALAPWVILLGLARFVDEPWTIGGAGIALLVGELGVRAAVFVFPQGSTSGLLLLFSPVYLTVIALLPGAVAGWLIGRCWRLSPWLGAPTAAIGVVAVAVLGLSLARPDLAPWAVAERRAALERIGDPRVAVAELGLERILVTATSAWYLTAELDAEPGDEIAVVSHREAVLLDPITFAEKQRFALGSPQDGLRWGWSSTLARFEDRVVVVQTGGGYSETEVLELDGQKRWRYRPDASLPPTALRPADLDRDGRIELYAASGTRVVRLDQQGREMWSRKASYGTRLLLVPSTGELPAWVVGTAFAGGRPAYQVWNERGDLLAEVVGPEKVGPTSVVDLEEGRLLLSGGGTVRAVDLEGQVRWELPLGELAFQQAAAVRFSEAGPAYLAIVAAAARDVGRWRLLVLSPHREPVYDEILGQSVSLLPARTANGGDVLLMRLTGEGLWRLRPGELNR